MTRNSIKCHFEIVHELHVRFWKGSFEVVLRVFENIFVVEKDLAEGDESLTHTRNLDDHLALVFTKYFFFDVVEEGLGIVELSIKCVIQRVHQCDEYVSTVERLLGTLQCRDDFKFFCELMERGNVSVAGSHEDFF